MSEEQATAAPTPSGDITQQATAPTPTTKPAKDPKRVEAGKIAAKKTKEAREAQKKALTEALTEPEEKLKKAQAKLEPSPQNNLQVPVV